MAGHHLHPLYLTVGGRCVPSEIRPRVAQRSARLGRHLVSAGVPAGRLEPQVFASVFVVPASFRPRKALSQEVGSVSITAAEQARVAWGHSLIFMSQDMLCSARVFTPHHEVLRPSVRISGVCFVFLGR